MNLANIRIGTYFPATSIIHRLNGQIKISFFVLISFALFFVSNTYGILAMFALFLVTFYMSGVSLLWLIKAIRPAFLLILFLLPIMFLLERLNWQEFFVSSAIVSFKIIILLAFLILLLFTTSKLDLINSFKAFFLPLKKIKFPVSKAALILTLMILFLPEFFVLAQTVVVAQKSRGTDFDSYKFFSRFKAFFLLPKSLVVAAYRKTIEFKLAVVARGYEY